MPYRHAHPDTKDDGAETSRQASGKQEQAEGRLIPGGWHMRHSELERRASILDPPRV